MHEYPQIQFFRSPDQYLAVTETCTMCGISTTTSYWDQYYMWHQYRLLEPLWHITSVPLTCNSYDIQFNSEYFIVRSIPIPVTGPCKHVGSVPITGTCNMRGIATSYWNLKHTRHQYQFLGPVTHVESSGLQNKDRPHKIPFSFFIFLETFHCSPDLITLGSHNVPFCDSARNFGFIINSKLSMKKRVIKICQTAYFELKHISSIRRFHTEDTAKTFVTSSILSWLDYCNCLLMGTCNSVIHPLQKIQNFAARLVLLAPCHQHSTPLLEKLHWLPISEHIKYKVACVHFNAINGSGPAYFPELLHELP